MAGEITIDDGGLTDLARSLERAGVAADRIDAKLRGIVEAEITNPIRRRTPRRSGNLVRSIDTVVDRRKSPPTIRVVQDVDQAVYGPIVHFGWSTRNIGRRAKAATNAKGKVTTAATRAAFRGQLEGALSQRAADKAFRQARDRTKRTGQTVRAVRGGPIKPNPWMYRETDRRRDDVIDRYEKQVDDIARAFEAG